MTHHCGRRLALLALAAMLLEAPSMATPALPAQDVRAQAARTTDTPCQLAAYPTKAAWEARAALIRRQILASAGLLPLPKRTPLRPRLFGRIERDGYSVEKVYLEPRPGFYLAGNLYRPLTPGRHPGVLCPHGHWDINVGRLSDLPQGSQVARAIGMARLGYVAFAYDMVGYVDTAQLPHLPFAAKDGPLWGLSLTGLQLWNSIRALDFLESLPDVDPERLACTGESGGGTQTFLLTAVDQRVKLAAPVCMVSAHFQGGCFCENGPSLRVGDVNNVEIAALTAPRPLIMVSATGDWTKNTPTVEYPWVRGIYRLYGAADRVKSVQIDAGHNYNQQSREAVYAWFRQWLDGKKGAVKEAAYTKEDEKDLRVFPDHQFPGRRLDAKLLAAEMTADRQQLLAKSWPTTKAAFTRWRGQWAPIFQASLALDTPARVLAELGSAEQGVGCTIQPLHLGRPGVGDRVPGVLLTPAAAKPARTVLLVGDQGAAAALGLAAGRPAALPQALLDQGAAVLAIDCLGLGSAARPPAPDTKFFTTYNRVVEAERVQDIVTALAWLRSQGGRVDLVGTGQAGLWCLLARALTPADSCAVDLANFTGTDQAFAERLPIPLIRAAGDLRAALTLAAPGPLLLWHAGKLDTAWAAGLYERLGRPDALVVLPGRAADKQIGEFLGK